MKRRETIIALAAFAAVPLAARGQATGKSYRIGFLGFTSAKEYAQLVNAFLQGLRDLGYEEGRSLAVEYRWAEGREERLPALAAELVQLNPDVLVSHAAGVGAAQRATSAIPIVMGVSADPVGTGYIKSFAKPGGNITGVASRLVDLASKRLELLKEAVPRIGNVAVLSNFALPGLQRGLEETKVAARKLGVLVHSFGVVPDPAALDSVFAAILRVRPDGLIVQPDPVSGNHGTRIAAFAITHRLPTIGGIPQFALDGGLLSYGPNFTDGWRLAARYVDKILKGAQPADLPVEQATTFELAVNVNTANALKLTLPKSLLLRANEVIK